MKRAILLKKCGQALVFLSMLALFRGCPAAGRKDEQPATEKSSSIASEQSPSQAASAPSGGMAMDQEAESEEAKPEQSGQEAAPSAVPTYDNEIPANLGQPLVDNPDDLKRLEPSSPVWIDAKNKEVILIGSVCRAGYPLEFFATYPDRAYESVLTIYTRPSVVHAAFLALGAKPGKPVQYKPTFAPPSGTEVEINVAWKDKDGKRQNGRARDWIRDIKTKRPLDVNWVFAGSLFWEDPTTGEKSYLADRGDFISVLNLPTALLDVPIEKPRRLNRGYSKDLSSDCPRPAPRSR